MTAITGIRAGFLEYRGAGEFHSSQQLRKESKGESMDATTARAQLRDFVVGSLAKPHLADQDDLFEVGEASSLYSLESVLFFEEKLGIPLDDQDVTPANFATIDAMGSLIEHELQTS